MFAVHHNLLYVGENWPCRCLFNPIGCALYSSVDWAPCLKWCQRHLAEPNKKTAAAQDLDPPAAAALQSNSSSTHAVGNGIVAGDAKSDGQGPVGKGNKHSQATLPTRKSTQQAGEGINGTYTHAGHCGQKDCNASVGTGNGNVDTLEKAVANGSVGSTRCGMTLPFTPLHVTFRNICYYVPMPEVLSTHHAFATCGLHCNIDSCRCSCKRRAECSPFLSVSGWADLSCMTILANWASGQILCCALYSLQPVNCWMYVCGHPVLQQCSQCA